MLITFFSVIFSIYAVLIFGDLCKPNGDDDDEDRFNWTQNIGCKKWSNGTDGSDATSTEYKTTQVTWVLLVIFTVYFWIREVLKLVADPRTFLSRMESFGDLAIDILLILALYKGFPHDQQNFAPIKYHLLNSEHWNDVPNVIAALKHMSIIYVFACSN